LLVGPIQDSDTIFKDSNQAILFEDGEATDHEIGLAMKPPAKVGSSPVQTVPNPISGA